MSTCSGDLQRWRYTVKLDEVPRRRFEDIWLKSFDLPGMNGIHLSRMAGCSRLYLHDRNLRIEDGSGKRNVKIGSLWADEVSSAFGIDPGLARKAIETLCTTKVPG
jgi:hypothetical protein